MACINFRAIGFDRFAIFFPRGDVQVKVWAIVNFLGLQEREEKDRDDRYECSPLKGSRYYF